MGIGTYDSCGIYCQQAVATMDVSGTAGTNSDNYSRFACYIDSPNEEPEEFRMLRWKYRSLRYEMEGLKDKYSLLRLGFIILLVLLFIWWM